MDMRISALTSIFFGLLLAATIGSGSLTLWHSAQSRLWDQRITLAQTSYAEHLALQSNIYQLFKQHGDALLFGDRDGGALEATLRERISENLEKIRHIIGQEIEMVGEEEFEELTLISQIENRVMTLTRILADLSKSPSPASEEQRRQALVEILDGEIDAKLSVRITEALKGELAEVVETLAEAETFRSRIRTGVIGIMLAATFLVGFAGWAYRKLVVLPTLQLVAKVEAFQAGKDRTVGRISGAMELQRLDLVLEAMVVSLDLRELSSQEHTAQLERAVQARTAELARVLTQIEQSETVRRQMMADVSHELRTPLTIIQGEAEVSLRGSEKTPEIYCESLARIRETARHANHVVDDLLLIARQESGKLRLDLRDVDLCAILREAVALFPREVTLDLPIPRANTKADPMRIRQCLLALFQNATRYGGGKVWARVEVVASGFALVVEDNGAGLGDAEKAQAFDRFFRGSNAGQPEIDGTGLGLPIVRAIAHAHGGSVTLQDREGGGLRVVIVLATERPIGLVWDSARQGTAHQ